MKVSLKGALPSLAKKAKDAASKVIKQPLKATKGAAKNLKSKLKAAAMSFQNPEFLRPSKDTGSNGKANRKRKGSILEEFAKSLQNRKRIQKRVTEKTWMQFKQVQTAARKDLEHMRSIAREQINRTQRIERFKILTTLSKANKNNNKQLIATSKTRLEAFEHKTSKQWRVFWKLANAAIQSLEENARQKFASDVCNSAAERDMKQVWSTMIIRLMTKVPADIKQPCNTIITCLEKKIEEIKAIQRGDSEQLIEAEMDKMVAALQAKYESDTENGDIESELQAVQEMVKVSKEQEEEGEIRFRQEKYEKLGKEWEAENKRLLKEENNEWSTQEKKAAARKKWHKVGRKMVTVATFLSIVKK